MVSQLNFWDLTLLSSLKTPDSSLGVSLLQDETAHRYRSLIKNLNYWLERITDPYTRQEV
jgi:hypothetical protein